MPTRQNGFRKHTKNSSYSQQLLAKHACFYKHLPFLSVIRTWCVCYGAIQGPLQDRMIQWKRPAQVLMQLFHELDVDKSGKVTHMDSQLCHFVFTCSWNVALLRTCQ